MLSFLTKRFGTKLPSKYSIRRPANYWTGRLSLVLLSYLCLCGQGLEITIGPDCRGTSGTPGLGRGHEQQFRSQGHEAQRSHRHDAQHNQHFGQRRRVGTEKRPAAVGQMPGAPSTFGTMNEVNKSHRRLQSTPAMTSTACPPPRASRALAVLREHQHQERGAGRRRSRTRRTAT